MGNVLPFWNIQNFLNEAPILDAQVQAQNYENKDTCFSQTSLKSCIFYEPITNPTINSGIDANFFDFIFEKRS